MTILLIDLCYEKDSLSNLEFVQPIKRIVESTKNKAEVVHYSELTEEHISAASHIILCGTALKDNAFQDNYAKFEWLKETKKQVLGICAGMQIIGLVFGAKLIKHKEIGMTQILTKDPLFNDTMMSAYELHGSSVTLPDGFTEIAYNDRGMQAFRKENIYGIQFHPEVRNRRLIETFLNP